MTVHGTPLTFLVKSYCSYALLKSTFNPLLNANSTHFHTLPHMTLLDKFEWSVEWCLEMQKY